MKEFAKGRMLGAVTVGERGQVVIPADIRKSFKIKPRDKLIVFSKPNMIGLMHVEEFSRFLEQATAEISKISR